VSAHVNISSSNHVWPLFVPFATFTPLFWRYSLLFSIQFYDRRLSVTIEAFGGAQISQTQQLSVITANSAQRRQRHSQFVDTHIKFRTFCLLERLEEICLKD